ncbi:MAG TPA: Type 1 glutamine amidotransferase-like domain-containing protein [Ktedonobacteraceae bacterium]|nr:Type 1 glutamine amidotransferase-like domain-containing protein [Ktedonobacteraceae bacterium]
MSATTGTLALVGSGEFLPPIEMLDSLLLGRIVGTPRVLILPTASAPDGGGVPQRWGTMGVNHFQKLGAEAEALMLLTRKDAESLETAEKIAQFNFIYLSGGKPQYVLDTFRNTPAWQAIKTVFEQGGVVAGCSAGAMAMTGRTLSFPQVNHTVEGLGLAPNFAVMPHFDEIPHMMSNLLSKLVHEVTVVGVDGSTGLVGADLDWMVHGKGSVTVFQGKQRTRYQSGERVQLTLP